VGLKLVVLVRRYNTNNKLKQFLPWQLPFKLPGYYIRIKPDKAWGSSMTQPFGQGRRQEAEGRRFSYWWDITDFILPRKPRQNEVLKFTAFCAALPNWVQAISKSSIWRSTITVRLNHPVIVPSAFCLLPSYFFKMLDPHAKKTIDPIATIQELKVIRAYLKSVNHISKYRIKLLKLRQERSNFSFNAIEKNKGGDDGILYRNKNIYISLKLMGMALAKPQFFVSTPSHTYSEHLMKMEQNNGNKSPTPVRQYWFASL
jgi:hypothetical protein